MENTAIRPVSDKKAESTVTETTHPYLAFTLGGEDYAVDVLKVREILTLVRMTPLPDSPDYLVGLINLRGSVIPVIALGTMFSLPEFREGPESRIIIVEIEEAGTQTVAGILVDSVQAVLRFDAEQLSEPPRIGARIRTSMIKAMAHIGDGFVIVLDIDHVFDADEVGAIEEARASVAGVPA